VDHTGLAPQVQSQRPHGAAPDPATVADMSATLLTPHNLILLLSRGIAQRRLFSADHPKVRDCHRDFVAELEGFFAGSALEPFFLGVESGKLIYQGRYLSGPNIVGGKLVELARHWRCGGFTFAPATTSDELSEFITLAAKQTHAEENLESARAMLRARGIGNIELAEIFKEADGADTTNLEIWQGSTHHARHADVLITQSLFDVVETAHGVSTRGRAPDLTAAKTISEQFTRAAGEYPDLLQQVHYPDYDTYTVGHSVRLAVLAVMVARKLDFSSEMLIEIGAAGLLHDVGKSRIPDEILYKPGRLDHHERKVMESHAVLGAEILMEHRDTSPMIVAAAWGHHLHHGGGGYPVLPFRPKRSPITALLQICDIFEALTAIRPYKAALSPRRAYEVMMANRSIFDPSALNAFVRSIGLYPPGCRVRLSDGGEGVVLAAGSDIDRPRLHRTMASSSAGGADPMLDLGVAANADLSVVGVIVDDALDDPSGDP